MVAAERARRRPARASVWLEDKARRGGAARGGQPSGLDRDRITAVAVALLDAEGLPKFSMRRLATELNVTAMSVYWYVDTKDDLLELALDAVFGEMRVPAAIPGDEEESTADWRDQLRELAVEYREVLVRHPWVSTLAGNFLNIGPNYLEFSFAVQRVIRRTGLPMSEQTGAISAVFQFVYGFGTIEGHFVERCAAAGVSEDEYFSEAMAAVTQAPRISHVMEGSKALMEARGGDTVAEMFERDFSTALEIVIGGIEARVTAV
ncbi:TetR/AcrR family transcriptional regulator [Streptomyces spongiae]|uniref:TetR/AcrR family transcriptional regulator n=1 Tax=Streptomyces spongiae TaxID=565072 RepID=A0A5N8XRX9_9ACTN|nr:TetR/AcrR family transcriptional regulator [Streptomyces spongiae]MPY62171.1 TetR/AcrR family transcriptional regulator [Streptomyces spongiae]